MQERLLYEPICESETERLNKVASTRRDSMLCAGQ